MGAPMAERLIDAGHRVRIYDPDASAVAPLIAAGATGAASAADAVD